MKNFLFERVIGDMSDKTKKNNWFVCNDHLWEQFNKGLALLFVILVLVIVLIQAAHNPDAIQRYNIQATGEQVSGGSGEAGAKMFGPLTLDSNNLVITYQFRTLSMADATSIRLMGPIVVGTDTGPIAAVLCGAPSPLPACDTTMPGEIPLTTVKDVYDGINPVGQSVEVLIRTVRANPHLYYLEALNANGGVRSPLNGISGTP